MGGNANFNGATAQPIIYHSKEQFERAKFEIAVLLSQINSINLWADARPFLSGSSYHLIDIDEETSKLFPRFGDIDIMVDKNKEGILKTFLEREAKWKIPVAKLIGHKKTVDQYVTLWEVHGLNQNVQIDFELVEIDPTTLLPNEWDRWVRSSSLTDARIGVKAFAHKLLMRALTAPTVQDRLVVTGGNMHTAKTERGSFFAFSYKGLREKYKILTVNDSNVYYKDALVYNRTSTSDRDGYIRNIGQVAEILLGPGAIADDLSSFTSICNYLDERFCVFKDKKLHQIREGFALLLFGPESQPCSSDPIWDREWKEHALKKFDLLITGI